MFLWRIRLSLPEWYNNDEQSWKLGLSLFKELKRNVDKIKVCFTLNFFKAFDAVQPSSGSVVDTIGAGDTFIAVVVACLAYGQTLSDSVKAGCRVAGNKVGQQGFKGLRRFFENS